MGVLFIFLKNSLYNFPTFVIKMLGYRKLEIGQILLGEESASRTGHWSAPGVRHREVPRMRKISVSGKMLVQPTAGEPALHFRPWWMRLLASC